MFFHDLRILAQGCIHISEDHTKLLEVLTHLVVDSFTFVLCCHASQVLLLGLRDTQAVECIPNLGRDVVPGLTLLCNGFNIVVDIVEINAR